MNFQINFNLAAIVRRISNRMVQILETSRRCKEKDMDVQ